jgi:hypothetical protein
MMLTCEHACVSKWAEKNLFGIYFTTWQFFEYEWNLEMDEIWDNLKDEKE